MGLSKPLRKFVTASILVMAFEGILVSRLHLEVFETEAESTPAIFFVPQARYLKPFLLGQEGFAADLIWIRTIGYFADELFGQKKFMQLENLVELATDLDPRFERIYTWAGAVFIYNVGRITKQKVRASNRILEKGWQRIQNDPVGWKHIPQYWMIPQMIGFNYAIELHDRQRGAPYIAAAARIPGVPDLYKTWAATLYRKEGNLDAAIGVLEDALAVETLKSQMASVDNTSIKQQIQERLDWYYARLGAQEAEKRRQSLQKLRGLIREWRRDLPFVDFDLFLLLRRAPEDQPESNDGNLWQVEFPLLNGITEG